MAVLETAIHAFTRRHLAQGVDHPVKPGDDGVENAMPKAPGKTQ
jgi:hypothetical protein